MPGNLRRKTTGKSGGPTEKDYLKARRQVLRGSQICWRCGEAIDLTLKPICRNVDTTGLTVFDVIPMYCGDGIEPCGHPRKAHPFSASADHVHAVSELPPDSPLLTDPRNMKACHLDCNRRRQAGKQDGGPVNRCKVSKDWYA